MNARFGRRNTSGSVLEPKCPNYTINKNKAKEVILENYPESDSETEDEYLTMKSIKNQTKENSELEDSESESELQSEDSPKKLVIWIRKAVPRKDDTRVDIYYYEK